MTLPTYSSEKLHPDYILQVVLLIQTTKIILFQIRVIDPPWNLLMALAPGVSYIWINRDDKTTWS